MTFLTHDHDLFTPRPSRETERRIVPAGDSRESAMRGFFRAAVTIMLGTAALAGIIALKAAVYLPHLNY